MGAYSASFFEVYKLYQELYQELLNSLQNCYTINDNYLYNHFDLIGFFKDGTFIQIGLKYSFKMLAFIQSIPKMFFFKYLKIKIFKIKLLLFKQKKMITKSSKNQRKK
jgi:hypothetical protein